MDSTFELQAGVRRLAGLGHPARLHGHRDVTVAAEVGLLGLKDLGTPAALVGVAQVHAQQVTREERGLLSALPCLDLEDDVLAIEWIARDEEFSKPLRDFLATHLESVGLLREGRIDIRELARSDDVVAERQPVAVGLDSGTQLGMSTCQATRLRGIGVDGRIGQAPLDRGVLGGQLDAGVEHGTYLSAMSGDALLSKWRHSDTAALSLPPKRFSNFATRPPESRIFWRPV